MQVMFTCECGQALRTEVSQAPVNVQCPSCGKMITVWPPAGVSGGAGGSRPAGGKALAALVLGLCGLVPVIGVLAAIPAIVLGLIVLVRKLPGRGFGIAGLSVALGSLLTIQAGTVLYAIMIYGMYSAIALRPMMVPTASALAAPSPPPTIVGDMPTEASAPRLSDDEIADALAMGFDLAEDPDAAAAAIQRARQLYDARALPGNRFECLRQYNLHLARRGRASFADPADAEKHRRAYDELVEAIREKYDSAEKLAGGGDWSGAGKIYESILAEVPLEDNPIHVNALAGAKRCDIMLSGDAVVPSAPPVAPKPGRDMSDPSSRPGDQ
jgi:hypothetical protein